MLLSQSHQVDVLSPIAAPRVLAVDAPDQSVVTLPFGEVSVRFSEDMFIGAGGDEGSVLNAQYYLLEGAESGPLAVQSILYDEATRNAGVPFGIWANDIGGLTAGEWRLAPEDLPWHQTDLWVERT